jgi:hypothetical protein
MTENSVQIVWFNFCSLGYPDWCPVATDESELMLQGAQDLLSRNPRHVCEFVIARTKKTLIRRARLDQINDHWVGQALLITAMQGLLGYTIPDVQHFDD